MDASVQWLTQEVGVRRLARRECGEIWLQLKCIRNFLGKQKPKVSFLVSLKYRIQSKMKNLDFGVNSF